MHEHLSLPSVPRSFAAGFLLIFLSIFFTALFAGIGGAIIGIMLQLLINVQENLSVFTMAVDIITLLAPIPALYCALQITQKLVKRYRGMVVYCIFMVYTLQSMIGAWFLPEDMVVLGVNLSEMPNLALKQTIISCLTLGVFHYWLMVQKRYGEW
jgi:hypothetical protein